MKEWIEEDATDKEIKQFLQFATGGASLPVGKKIGIEEQSRWASKPYVVACTCGMRLEISAKMKYSDWDKQLWDDTKEKFIANLKNAIAVEGFQIS